MYGINVLSRVQVEIHADFRGSLSLFAVRVILSPVPRMFLKCNLLVIEARCGKFNQLQKHMCKYTSTPRLFNLQFRFRNASGPKDISAYKITVVKTNHRCKTRITRLAWIDSFTYNSWGYSHNSRRFVYHIPRIRYHRSIGDGR